MIKYFKKWISAFLSRIELRKRKRKEHNCKNGLHSWDKNPNWYITDKYDNRIFYSKYEFREIDWFTEIYYMQCECCGYRKITREKMNI